jgi:drug/metabolite transporter (DMT)-like permease
MIMAYVRLRLGVRHSLGEFIGVLCAFAGIGLALIGEVSGEQSTSNPLGLLGDFMFVFGILASQFGHLLAIVIDQH